MLVPFKTVRCWKLTSNQRLQHDHLWFIKSRSTRSGFVEAHYSSGDSDYQSYHLLAATPLRPEDSENGTFSAEVGELAEHEYYDIHFIKTKNVANIELHRLTG